MFAVVNLNVDKNEYVKVSVPFKWIQGVNIVAASNDGVNCEEKVKVFYSPLKFEDPDFCMEISTTFVRNKRACYIATVYRFWGKLMCFTF